MIFDESSRALAAPELARLGFRRNMEIGMLAALGGGLAVVVGLPWRFGVWPTELKPVFFSIPLALIIALEAFFFVLWRWPPSAAVGRFARAIERKRQAGARVGALSRAFVAFTGVLAFGCGLAVAMFIPVG